MTRLREWISYLKAFFRADLGLVCEWAGKGQRYDFHDYPDDELGSWMCHMVPLTCKRCGRTFYC